MTTRHYSTNKDIDALVCDLVRQGWIVRRGGKHKKLIAPNGNTIGIPGTPSDYRAVSNFIARVRQQTKEEA